MPPLFTRPLAELKFRREFNGSQRNIQVTWSPRLSWLLANFSRDQEPINLIHLINGFSKKRRHWQLFFCRHLLGQSLIPIYAQESIARQTWSPVLISRIQSLFIIAINLAVTLVNWRLLRWSPLGVGKCGRNPFNWRDSHVIKYVHFG